MRSTRINRGDVFWIGPDDSRGPVPSYSHPHVVVQDDVFNHSRITTVVVCALTSNLHRANEPGNVLLEVGEGNLPKQSVVVVSQISSVEKARLGERIGSLSDTRVPFDVPKRLGQAQRSLIDQRDPSWRSYLAWFEIYLALSASPPAEVRDALLLPTQPEPTGMRPP